MPFIVSKAISPEGSIQESSPPTAMFIVTSQKGRWPTRETASHRSPQVDFSILVRGCRGKIVPGVANDSCTHCVSEGLHQGGDTCVQSSNGVADFSAAWNC